jgi:hypothetical protein
MIFSCSMTEPGQPCETISGSASACGDLTWMKWMATLSIWVVNCGSAFSFPPHARPVVLVGPVAGESLDRGQLHALRPVGDEFPGGPACRGDAPPKVSDRFAGHVEPERMDFSFPWPGPEAFSGLPAHRSARWPAGRTDRTDSADKQRIGFAGTAVMRSTLAEDVVPGELSCYENRATE